MKDADFRSYIRSERQKLIHYVRSLLRESADMDAEDIVHDVLLKIFERANLIVPADNPAAYVYRSLKNRVIDYRRTRKPAISIDADEEGGSLADLLQDVQANALERLQTWEGEAELFVALDRLSEIERNVIIQHELEGVPFKELARLWNIPQNTLLSHKSRAMKKLKHDLTRG